MLCADLCRLHKAKRAETLLAVCLCWLPLASHGRDDCAFLLQFGESLVHFLAVGSKSLGYIASRNFAKGPTVHLFARTAGNYSFGIRRLSWHLPYCRRKLYIRDSAGKKGYPLIIFLAGATKRAANATFARRQPPSARTYASGYPVLFADPYGSTERQPQNALCAFPYRPDGSSGAHHPPASFFRGV